jgi:pimeloyl-ACP methyl ester carboxylesterase
MARLLLAIPMLALASQCLQAQTPPQATGRGAARIASDNLHLSCVGAGSPPVILEAGAGRGASDWDKVQPGVGSLTQVCSYDRGKDRCCEDVINDLRALLRGSSLRGPYVFVGHSLGGLYVRRFAARFPDDAAGLVLVDSADEKQLTGIIAPGLKPELYRPGAMSDAELQAFFRDLGQRMLAQRPAPAAGNTNGASDGAAGEIRAAQFYRQIANDRRDFMFSPKPLVVLTATLTAPMPRFSDEQRVQLEEDHRALQARMRLLSRNSKQILVPNSGHYIPLDRPDIVIAAIREVVTAVRRGGPLDPEGNLERLRL